MASLLNSSVFFDDNKTKIDDKLNISIRPETLFDIAGIHVTNGMLTTAIAVILCAALFAYLASKPKLKPGGRQAFGEFIVESLLGQVEGSLGRRNGRILFPLIATFFIFIIFANWFSLLPGIGTIGLQKGQIAADTKNNNITTAPYALTSGAVTLLTNNGTATNTTLLDATPVRILNPAVAGPNGQQLAQVVAVPKEWDEGLRPAEDSARAGFVSLGQLTPANRYKILIPFFRAPNADINMTLAMALIAVLLSEILTIRAHGLKGWLKEFFPSAKLFWLGPIEIASHLSRVISLTFRLYGNVFAGEVMIAIILNLNAGVLLFVFIGLEVFFGFIQALVFFLLSTAYFSLGIVGQGDPNELEHGAAHPPTGGDADKDVHIEERALQEAGAAR